MPADRRSEPGACSFFARFEFRGCGADVRRRSSWRVRPWNQVTEYNRPGCGGLPASPPSKWAAAERGPERPQDSAHGNARALPWDPAGVIRRHGAGARDVRTLSGTRSGAQWSLNFQPTAASCRGLDPVATPGHRRRQTARMPAGPAPAGTPCRAPSMNSPGQIVERLQLAGDAAAILTASMQFLSRSIVAAMLGLLSSTALAERDLLNAHGTFYEVPAVSSGAIGDEA